MLGTVIEPGENSDKVLCAIAEGAIKARVDWLNKGRVCTCGWASVVVCKWIICAF